MPKTFLKTAELSLFSHKFILLSYQIRVKGSNPSPLPMIKLMDTESAIRDIKIKWGMFPNFITPFFIS